MQCSAEHRKVSLDRRATDPCKSAPDSRRRMSSNIPGMLSLANLTEVEARNSRFCHIP